MLRITKIEEATSVPKKGKAFLLPGSFSPYTVGHHEVARQAAAHAASTGHTHFYHGIGAATKQSKGDPLTHGQKRSVIRAGHKELAKAHKGMKFRTTGPNKPSPFDQITHLAQQGHSHVTVGLGSDQMKGKLKSEIEGWVRKNKGVVDETGKVHKTTVSFHQLGGERREGDMPRHEVLSSLRKGDVTVAKAGRLRKAVASGDVELAHALMPKHIDKPKYFNLIKKQQSKIAKPKKIVKEGYMSFLEFIGEDIELDPYIDPPEGKKHKFGVDYLRRKSKSDFIGSKLVGHKNLGEIHPGYELHKITHRIQNPRNSWTNEKERPHHIHSFSIVHKKSGDVAGEIDAKGGKIDRKTGEHRLGTGKGLKIDWVHVHPEHGTKKVGTSLAAAAYKHLHKLGHSIKSDTRQSIGGANLWNSLRHDPDTKHHMKFHDERDNKAIPAHKVPEGEIWHDEPHAQETSLVLHAAKKTRAKKTVSEDISIVDVPQEPYQKKRKAKDVHQDYGTKTYSNETIVTKKNHGEIHPGYELHQHSKLTNLRGKEVLRHKFTVVHKATGDVAGEMHSWGGKLHPHKGHVMGPKGKGMVVTHLDFDPDHSSKKVGTSLPIAMYRHLHRKGFSIQADSAQSHGGAHVWNTMRKDKELGKHMVMHEPDDSPTPPKTKHSFSTLASKAPESQIWYQRHRDAYRGREKVKPQHGGEERDVTLILTGKKQKVVKEDIEMADVLDKPERMPGGYHRSWEKYKEITGTKPRKSARIAPGYVMHSSVPNKDNPEIEIHHIVHAKTGHIAGEVHTHETMSGARTAVSVQVDRDHTHKKIGRSLAIDAYKHLAKEKPLRSSSLQVPGGASIWDRLRKDSKMKGRVFHGGRLDRPDVPAHDLDSKQIWVSERKVDTSKGTPKPLHGGGKTLAHERQQVMGSRLYILPLKKKASKKS